MRRRRRHWFLESRLNVQVCPKRSPKPSCLSLPTRPPSSRVRPSLSMAANWPASARGPMNTTNCATTHAAGPTAVTCSREAVPQFHYAPLYWLAVGTFAVGTEGFMIAAILPRMATDLFVSVQAAGQLVTIFAFTYAVSSPILTALTGGFDRRKLLILSMSAFAVANLAAAWSQHFW